MLLRSLGLLSALTLAACATSYAPQSLLSDGGYTETRVGVNVWEVNFEGNSFTEHDAAVDMALLRSAELMEQHGFQYFVAGGSELSEDIGVESETSTVHTAILGMTTRTEVQDGEQSIESAPSVTTLVAGFEEKPDCPGPVYRTASVLKLLREKYQS